MSRVKCNTKYTGVRYYEHPTRKLRGGGLDRYYSIRYKIAGKVHEEGLGWASENWNAEKAHLMRSQIKQAQRSGEGPQSLAEMRMASQAAAETEAMSVEAEKTANMTLAEFFEVHYLPRAKKEKRSWSSDANRFASRIAPALGHLPLLAITREDIQAFLDDLVDNGSAPATVKQFMAIIRRAYNIAAETFIGGVPIFSGTNPAKGVRLPAVHNSRERFLTGDEADMLIAAASKMKNRDLHDAVVLSLNTGLRMGELLRLTWMDVDFSTTMISVRDEALRKPGGKVPMNEAAETVLRARKPGADPTALVFPPVYGRGLRENLSHEFHRLANQVGLNKGLAEDDRQRRIVFHSLRHTFASWLALAGVDIYRIKTLMRHKTLTMTMRYAHLIPDATRDAVLQLSPPKKRA